MITKHFGYIRIYAMKNSNHFEQDSIPQTLENANNFENFVYFIKFLQILLEKLKLIKASCNTMKTIERPIM